MAADITTELPTGFNSTPFMNLTSINGTSNTTDAPKYVMELDHLFVAKIIYDYLGPSTCMFGMVTNIINLIVLTQNELPESPYTQLTGLACTDFGALFLSFIYMTCSRGSTSYWWRFFDSYIFIGFVNVFTTGSIWITVQLTIERYLFVAHPLWAKDTCDRASAKFKILFTMLASCVFNIPRFFILKPRLTNGNYGLESTAFRKKEFFYVNWAYSISVHFVPLLILSWANAYLVYAVHKAGKQRQRLEIRNNREAAWQREQRRLTITLISIVFLFIVCIIPSAFSDRPISYALFGGDKTIEEFTLSNFYFNLQYIANYLVWLELSLNFVLYCAFNEKFRRVMRSTAKRCLKRIRSPVFRRQPTTSKVLFKSGHSSTRNSVLNTNSLMMNSKGSLTQQESQPLQVKADKADLRDSQYGNGDAPMME